MVAGWIEQRQGNSDEGSAPLADQSAARDENDERNKLRVGKLVSSSEKANGAARAGDFTFQLLVEVVVAKKTSRKLLI